ncbi:D-glycero-beta-D-manno-heptose-1,7-bisphosphate 7-phosphatase [Candidatus Magnetomoraceae bacterium gMMP-15]
MLKSIFIDRDGVINQDSPDYIKNWSEFNFIPGSIEAIARLTQNGYICFIITNQSMINRGISTKEALKDMHQKMTDAIEANRGRIEAIFYCPHRPDEGCNCRKPKPGLIYQVRQFYDIDLKNSCMVGDSVKDIEWARNAGCGFAILVRTGNGFESEKILIQRKIFPDYVADNLLAASEWIINSI